MRGTVTGLRETGTVSGLRETGTGRLSVEGFPVIKKVANDLALAYAHGEEVTGNAFELYINKSVLRYAMQAAYVLHLQVFYDWRNAYNKMPLTKFKHNKDCVIDASHELNLMILMPYSSELLLHHVSVSNLAVKDD